jgi:hypothetical protein
VYEASFTTPAAAPGGVGQHLGVARSFQQVEVPMLTARRIPHDLHQARCRCVRVHAAARPVGGAGLGGVHRARTCAPWVSTRGIRPLKTQQKITGRLTSDEITQDRLDILSLCCPPCDRRDLGRCGHALHRELGT